MKTDFLGSSYQSRSLPLAGQTLVNLYFEPAPPGSSEPGMFFGSPGLDLQSVIDTGPFRGAHTANGIGYVVSGINFYSVSGAGVATLIGACGGSGRVCIQHNDVQVIVMHSAGWSVLTLATGVYANVPGAPMTAQGTYQDSYIVYPQADGTYGWTNIDDATSLDALNFASAEAQPDPVISVLSDHRELWLFGTTTTEIAQTSGDADLVFVRTAILEYGCCAKYTPAKSDNTIFWVAQNESGRGMVMMAQGYTPSRISTHALEDALASYGDLSNAWGYCYQQNGHTFYVLTVPNFATWSYDSATQRWTQLTHRNTITGAREQHRAGCYLYLNGSHLVGDYVNGNLYVLDLDTYTDNGDLIERERAWAVIENENRWIRHNRLELICEMGVGLDGILLPGSILVEDESGTPILDEIGYPVRDESDPDLAAPGGDPLWLLDWSDDGCHNWSNTREIRIGTSGHYRNRGVARRCGLSRRRVYRLRTTEPCKITAYGVNIDATQASK